MRSSVPHGLLSASTAAISSASCEAKVAEITLPDTFFVPSCIPLAFGVDDMDWTGTREVEFAADSAVRMESSIPGNLFPIPASAPAPADKEGADVGRKDASLIVLCMSAAASCDYR
jgi:hypothetical protein